MTPDQLVAASGFAIILALLLLYTLARYLWSLVGHDTGYKGPQQDGDVTISLFETTREGK